MEATFSRGRVCGWPPVDNNSFHFFARRTSGGDASRAVDETQQSGSADNPLLLAGHSHLPELSVEVSGGGTKRFTAGPYIAQHPRWFLAIK